MWLDLRRVWSIHGAVMNVEKISEVRGQGCYRKWIDLFFVKWVGIVAAIHGVGGTAILQENLPQRVVLK